MLQSTFNHGSKLTGFHPRYPITKSSNRTPVIGHPRDHAPITWQISARGTNQDREFCYRYDYRPNWTPLSPITITTCTFYWVQSKKILSSLVVFGSLNFAMWREKSWYDNTRIFFWTLLVGMEFEHCEAGTWKKRGWEMWFKVSSSNDFHIPVATCRQIIEVMHYFYYHLFSLHVLED